MANEFFQKGKINEKYQYELAKSLLERLELNVDPYTQLGELGISISNWWRLPVPFLKIPGY